MAIPQPLQDWFVDYQQAANAVARASNRLANARDMETQAQADLAQATQAVTNLKDQLWVLLDNL